MSKWYSSTLGRPPSDVIGDFSEILPFGALEEEDAGDWMASVENRGSEGAGFRRIEDERFAIERSSIL